MANANEQIEVIVIAFVRVIGIGGDGVRKQPAAAGSRRYEFGVAWKPPGQNVSNGSGRGEGSGGFQPP